MLSTARGGGVSNFFTAKSTDAGGCFCGCAASADGAGGNKAGEIISVSVSCWEETLWCWSSESKSKRTNERTSERRAPHRSRQNTTHTRTDAPANPCQSASRLCWTVVHVCDEDDRRRHHGQDDVWKDRAGHPPPLPVRQEGPRLPRMWVFLPLFCHGSRFSWGLEAESWSKRVNFWGVFPDAHIWLDYLHLSRIAQQLVWLMHSHYWPSFLPYMELYGS